MNMVAERLLRVRALGLAVYVAVALPAQAAILYWDANGAGATGNPPAANVGGTGTFTAQAGSALWWNGTAYQDWVTNSVADFRVTAGTVTLSTNTTAGGLVFSSAGWVLANSGGAILTMNNVASNITFSGNRVTISCLLAGPLNFNGTSDTTGHLISGANTGVTSVNVGMASGSIVSVNNPASFGNAAAPVSIAAGARLYLENSAAGGVSYTNWPTTLAGGWIRVRNGQNATAGVSTYPGNITLSADSGLTVRGAANNGLICYGTIEVAAHALTVTAADLGNGIDLQNTVSGTGSITLDSNVIDVITTGAGVVKLSADNSFSGTVSVVKSTLALNNTNAVKNAELATGSATTANTVTFTVGGTNTYNIGAISGSDNLEIGGNALRIGSKAMNTTYSGTISGSGGGLVKVGGSSTLTLSGVNSYSGSTTVNAGELNIQNAGAIGGSSVSVTGGRVVVRGGTTIPNTKTITVRGDGVNYFGALQGNSGVNEWQGEVTIGSATTRIGVNTGTFTISGAIGSGGSYGIMFRPGTGVLVLSGANNYLGDTTIVSGGGLVRLSGGINRLPTGTKLILGASATSGTLDLNGQSQEVAGLSVGSGTANIVMNSSGTLSVLTVNTTASSTFSSDGTITGNIALLKSGSETLTLAGVNAYTGTTSIAGSGALKLSDNLAIQNSAFNTDITGGGTLDLTSVNTPTFGGLTGAGNLTLPANVTGLTLNIVTGAMLTYTGILSGGTAATLTKNGAGIQTLSGASTYTGLTTVNAGTLQLGINNAIKSGNSVKVYGNAAGVTAVLDLTGNNQTINTLTLGGATTTSRATVTGAGTLTITGDIAYSDTNDPLGANISVTTLDLNGGTRDANVRYSTGVNTELTISANIQNGKLTVNDEGGGSSTAWLYSTVKLTGSNIFGGGLQLGSANNFNNYGTVQLASATGNAAGAGPVRVYVGAIDLLNTVQTINGLSMGGRADVSGETVSTVNIGTGELKLGGNVTLDTGDSIALAGGGVISGTGAGAISLLGNRTFTVSDVNATSDLVISAIIQDGDGTARGLTKAGAGVMKLSGTNTFSGVATLTAGTLNLANQNALQNSTLTMKGGDLVFDSSVSGKLFTFGGLAATTSGTGYDIALLNNAGTPSAIGLTVGGNNANTTYAGILSGAAGSLTKAGTGTFILSGANAYTGTTTVNGGTLRFDAIPTGNGAAIVNSLGTLYLNVTGDWSGNLSSITGTGSLTLKTNGGTMSTPTVSGFNGTAEVLSAGGTSGRLLVDSAARALPAGATLIIDSGATAWFEVNDDVPIQVSGTGNSDGLGALRLTSATLGGTVTLMANSSIGGNSTDTGTISGSIGQNVGPFGITKVGFGSVTLTGANTYTGGTTVNNGALYLNHAGGPAIKGDATITGNATGGLRGRLYLLANNQLESTAIVSMSSESGSYADFVLGGSSQTIAGFSASGAGVQYIENYFGASHGTGTLTFDISNANTLTSDVQVRDGYTGSGALAIIKDGTGALTAGVGSIGNTGGWILKNGTLKLSGNNFGASTPITLQGGTLSSDGTAARTVSGGITIAGDITLGDAANNGTLTIQTGAAVITGTTPQLVVNSPVVISQAISGSGLGLTKAGPGRLTLSGANQYTGTTTVNSGTLVAGNATAFGPAANARLAFGSGSTGVVMLSGNSMTVTGLDTDVSTPGTPLVESGSASAGTDTLTVDNSSDSSYAGALQNGSTRSLALTKSGGGTLTLSGTNNTYTGITTVQAGTIKPAATNSLSAASGLLMAGGTLDIGALSQTVSSVSGTGTLKLNAGLNGAGGVINTAGNLDVSGLTLDIANLDQPDRNQDYIIATSGGTLIGSFLSSNVVVPWELTYDQTEHQIRLTSMRGTVIIVR